MLANEGAEVIRVEPPGGATDREVMPVGVGGRGGLYLQMNAGKRSITLDFADPAGRSVLESLIRTSDVVVVNLPGGALARLGLDYQSLQAIKPDIILTTISAFDSSGRDRDRVGFDGTGQALSGSMYLTGSGERPTRAAVSYVDYATGMSAAFATLSALIERAASGRGQHIRCSLMGMALTMMNPMLMEEASGYRSRTPITNRSPIAGPSDLFRSKDGWVMVQVIGDAMFRRWTELVKRPDLLADPRFRTDSDRGDNGAELSAIMAEWCAARTTQECLSETTARRLPACPCLTPKETLEMEGLGDYADTITFEEDGKTVPLITKAIHTATSEERKPQVAPKLGADTDQVLAALGMTDAEIRKLRDRGIV